MTAIATLPVLAQQGTHASRPAASAVGSGALYACTTHRLIYQMLAGSWGTWFTPDPSGTSFPGSPATSDRFWRTDLGMEAYYDGTHWLTTQLFTLTGQGDALDGTTTNSLFQRLSPWHTTFDLWLDTFYASNYIATTNNGTNFWTVAVQKFNAAGSGTTVVSYTTASDTVDNYSTHSVSIGAAMGTSNKHLTIASTKTLSPGALYFAGFITYRLILT